MNILWAGNEDIDWSILGTSALGNTDTTAGHFRSGWSRSAVPVKCEGNPSSWTRSYPFPGGAVVSAWLSFQNITLNSTGNAEGTFLAAFGLSGTNSAVGLAGGASTGYKVSLCKFDGTTTTTLAAESGTSLANGVSNRFDMQLTSYGATSTVNVYMNGALIISYSGSTAVAGMANFDSVFIGFNTLSGGSQIFAISEVIVADSDTRGLLGLNTLALTGAGTTTQWTNNTYTNINSATYSDNSPTYVNTTAKDQEYAVGTVQPAVYSVIAVVQSARLATPAGSTPTQVKLGYGSSGTGYFGTGAAKTPVVGFSTYQQIDPTNPITSVPWVSSDLSAPLQLDIQSA